MHGPYPTKELRRLMDDGPSPGEDFYRVKVTGSGETHWFNVTPDELDAITRILERRDA